MPPRRPSASVDIERFMKRVETMIGQSSDAALSEIGALKFAVLKGNMNTELLAQRLTEIELQLIEGRQSQQLAARQGVVTAEVVAVTAVKTATAVAKAAPNIRTKLGLITAVSGTFVAMVLFFTNLPKFVRGVSEVVVGVYTYLVGHR